jgi:hypothetical protein
MSTRAVERKRKRNSLGYLGFLGFLGVLGLVTNAASLIGLFGLFAFFALFKTGEMSPATKKVWAVALCVVAALLFTLAILFATRILRIQL